MALDKWIAVVFLVISIIYGYTAYTYPLLPFERNMIFLPNTMPMVLSALAILFALLILFTPSPKADAEGEALGNINLKKWRKYKVGQALGLIALMTLYALTLRPVGFITATTLFLVGAGWTLGERKLVTMTCIALTGALCIWYLVQEVLGIFLRPLPWFLG